MQAVYSVHARYSQFQTEHSACLKGRHPARCSPDWGQRSAGSGYRAMSTGSRSRSKGEEKWSTSGPRCGGPRPRQLLITTFGTTTRDRGWRPGRAWPRPRPSSGQQAQLQFQKISPTWPTVSSRTGLPPNPSAHGPAFPSNAGVPSQELPPESTTLPALGTWVHLGSVDMARR